METREQIIEVAENCTAEIIKNGNKTIVKITPKKDVIKVGDWIQYDNCCVLVQSIKGEFVYGQSFNLESFEYCGVFKVAIMHFSDVYKSEIKLDKEEIEERLKNERAMYVTNESFILPWRAKYGEKFESIISFGSKMTFEENESLFCDKSYNDGNYFPVGFLTQDMLNEYNDVLKGLFEEWRKY